MMRRKGCSRSLVMFVVMPNARPAVEAMVVIKKTAHSPPPIIFGKEWRINQENASPGGISTPEALTARPTQMPKKPRGGIRKADIRAPVRAVCAFFAEKIA